MFGKLLKYDFRSMWKQFAFIWPAALALALVNHFTINGLDGSSTVGETTAGISMLVYVAILMAMFIVALVFAIQRFFKGLLGDEGYLMTPFPCAPGSSSAPSWSAPSLRPSSASWWRCCPSWSSFPGTGRWSGNCSGG